MLCTCEWPLRPLEYFQCVPCGGGRDAPCTCGGVPLNREGVDAFVGGVSALLTKPRGVAVFDHEGGWPFGLESLLRQAAKSHGLHLYTRRGPLFTNFDYVLSAAPLRDDVSGDILQRTARLTDVLLVTFPFAAAAFIAAARHGDVPREYLPLANACKAAIAVALALRLTLPFFDVLTLDDVGARMRGNAND